MIKISKKRLIELANLQNEEYFEKFHDILSHNLRMTMKKVKRERDRPGYEMTSQILEQTEMRQGIINCWLLEEVINTKKIMTLDDSLKNLITLAKNL